MMLFKVGDRVAVVADPFRPGIVGLTGTVYSVTYGNDWPYRVQIDGYGPRNFAEEELTFASE